VGGRAEGGGGVGGSTEGGVGVAVGGSAVDGVGVAVGGSAEVGVSVGGSREYGGGGDMVRGGDRAARYEDGDGLMVEVEGRRKEVKDRGRAFKYVKRV